MMPVMEFAKSDKRIGLIVKPARLGPESRLANIFIERTISQLMKQKTQYAIFIEPQLEPIRKVLGFYATSIDR